MSEQVQRWVPYMAYDDDGDEYSTMAPYPTGTWVALSDYESLRAKLETAEKERDSLLEMHAESLKQWAIRLADSNSYKIRAEKAEGRIREAAKLLHIFRYGVPQLSDHVITQNWLSELEPGE